MWHSKGRKRTSLYVYRTHLQMNGFWFFLSMQKEVGYSNEFLETLNETAFLTMPLWRSHIGYSQPSCMTKWQLCKRPLTIQLALLAPKFIFFYSCFFPRNVYYVCVQFFSRIYVKNYIHFYLFITFFSIKKKPERFSIIYI